MTVPRRTFPPPAGFVSHFFMQLVAVVICLALLTGLVLGSWPVRIAILLLVTGFGLWLFWTMRQQDKWMRMAQGQRVRVVLGTHSGRLGTVVESSNGTGRIQIALDADEPAE